MMAEIKEKAIWEHHLKQLSGSVFLLDWWWGEFQKSAGRGVCRLTWMGESGARAAVQIFFQPFFGRIGYGVVTRCPLYAEDITRDEQKKIEEDLAAWCAGKHEKQRWIFWRIEPLQELEAEFFGALKTFTRQPQTTLLLEVSRNQEVLLQEMHEKTRYNIRLAAKKDLMCRVIPATEVTKEVFNAFWNLMGETGERAGIKSHKKAYYWQLFQNASLEHASDVYLVLISKENQALAGGVFIGSGNTLTYLYGASSNRERNSMAPYFMHWQMIQFAHTHGLRWYDWWGVNPESVSHDAYKNSWEGITRFKEGFGGIRTSYPQAREFPIDACLFKAYQLIKSII
ncbi:MAG: peptidoglycan bridge formation glycyltransferase FemA/FemB family protein [Candidatus Magasanikbacteria bacterium]|nr:peptidoglycan bridge formation glycyltransferase FemA/FemB family protein [Candidatus Magasanikbacteria bacterium]